MGLNKGPRIGGSRNSGTPTLAKSLRGLKGAPAIEDRNRLTKSLPSNGGGGPRVPNLKIKESVKSSSKEGWGFREMEI